MHDVPISDACKKQFTISKVSILQSLDKRQAERNGGWNCDKFQN